MFFYREARTITSVASEIVMDNVQFYMVDPLRSVIVEVTDNGFLISSFDVFETTGEISIVRKAVIENDVRDINDFEAVRDMLYLVLDGLSIYNSDHFTKRIEIKVVDQDSV